MIIGNKVYHKKTVTSSLEWAKDNLSEPDGTVFLADYIEHARGRSGRVWKASVGQALITILLKPENKNLHKLGMALSLGFLTPLKKYNVKIEYA